MAGAGEHIVAISVAGSRLVYSKSVADFDLWRMELGPDGKAGPETLFLHSTRSERFPVFAPDGREIAFISDRSGEAELWVANADGSAPRQLTKAAPVGLLPWAMDSSEILYHASPEKGRGNFRIRSQGGEARRRSRVMDTGRKVDSLRLRAGG